MFYSFRCYAAATHLPISMAVGVFAQSQLLEAQKMKGNYTQQENLENIHIDRFHKLCGIPGKMIPRKKNQRPDFLYRREDGIIGIEHTTIKMKNLKVLKGIQRQIVNRAKEFAEAEGIPPLGVMVHFHDYYTKYPQRGNRQAELLFNAVKENIERAKNSNSHIAIDPPQPFCGIDGIYVSYGELNGVQWLRNHRWSVDEVGWVRIGFGDELRDVIKKKNTLVNEYLQQCDSCWLLIVGDRAKSDEKFMVTKEMQDCSYVSLFERTFFMEPTEGVLFELKTESI